MLNDIKAVLFDLDGTLVESMSMWGDIDVDYLKKFHIPVPEGLQKAIEGLSMYQTAVYFKENFAIEDSLEEIMDEWNRMAYEKYTTEIPLKPGARAFLNGLKDKNIPCGIATSNSRILTEAILKSHQVENYFSVMVTGDEITNGKPDPEVYLEAAKKMGVAPEHCLVFEDIPFGIIAGKRAGMTVCAVEDAYSMKDMEEKIRLADFYIKSYEELL
ncbi:HAD family phosphatase [Frisingicoccus caecimuris]|uniref:HAD superfamily hydrolase (TIGR01509 family)/HAD superfamily hydrolase (TIGR01549 family) n=1 Tax=Frisingicoccus caecimuris TaxID=1796636 RepID=A0A4R2LE20_9FIRM|nr:HAD family phosphatase [Frisingicoccus caecimuris]MCR1918690.1 HAD family phosphatase [Frisingicoccus caecimuris]TCO86322.1 HAD superfamily hydrolase (TIGR01509 family)/HAD superfamily hydrolase (TIGR01549 family) [Frisingicoccus caecimuris]